MAAYQFDYSNPCHVYFCGIGGISMSGLAEILLNCAVFTAAIRPENPEYRACKEKGIPMMTRAELLGQIMTRYKNSIAVSGTHGKTTTTAMLSHIMMKADEDPTISIGGVLPLINGNIRIGGNENFLLEACEYTNSFLSFNPTMEIILNTAP